MPAPFPKACVQCAKSKKRCDLTTPCSRCQLRGVRCRYENVRVSASVSAVPATLTGLDLHPGAAEMEPRQPGSMSLEANDNGLCFETIDALPFDFDKDWPNIMTDIDQFVVPDRLGSFNSPERSVLAGDVYQERIVYSVKRIQAYPSLFVSAGQTPFLHPGLYKGSMPLVLQDALAVSALYGAKTSTNEALVFATIGHKAKQLLECQQTCEQSAIEQLASLQALVLYQIIRLFDGDIRLRAEAERSEAVMMEWTRQLQARIRRAGAEAKGDLGSSLDLVTDPWRSWLFTESQRRTVIICFSIQGLYCFLKNGWDNSHHDFEELSFYAQRSLWAASSEYQWRSAMEKRHSLPVRFPTWDDDMKDAMPSDIEDLGVMMMALTKGVDGCSQWLGEGYLERYGLSVDNHAGN